MKGHVITKNIINNITYRDVDIANCITSTKVIKNNIEARCQVIRGELQYNSLLGIPLGGDKDIIDLSIMTIILETYGVSEIKKFISSIKNRKYSLSAKILTLTNNEISVEV